MYHDQTSDFAHPRLPEGHALKQHLLYRIKAGHFTQVWETPPADFQACVAVAACYVEIDGRILLMKRSKSSLEGQTWGVPAGKIEPGESPLQAAVRELMEESGIQVSFSQVTEVGTLYVQKPRGSYIYHMFQVHLNQPPTVILSLEHTQYVWANAQEINTLHLIGGGKAALNHYAREKKPR